MRAAIVIASCLSLLFAGNLGAQQLSRSPFSQPGMRLHGESRLARQAEPSTLTLALAGAGGVSAGVLLGGLLGGALGFALAQCDDQDGCVDDYVDWAFNGAAVGSSLLVPLGVHLANRRYGRVAPALLASAGIGAVGLGVFWRVQKDEGPGALMAASLVATPALQMLSSIVIERVTSRRRR